MALISNQMYGGASTELIKRGEVTSGVFLGIRLVVGGILVANPISRSDSVVTFIVMFPLGWIFVQLGKYFFRLSLAMTSTFEDDATTNTQNITTWQVVVEGLPFKSASNWGNALLEGL